MNPLNYATPEASKRLADAGIVLETEAFWDLCISAPSMAEVWRELPKQEHTVRYGASLELSKTINFQGEEVTYAGYLRDGIASTDYTNTNPTDALIDLLIWVRKEKL